MNLQNNIPKKCLEMQNDCNFPIKYITGIWCSLCHIGKQAYMLINYTVITIHTSFLTWFFTLYTTKPLGISNCFLWCVTTTMACQNVSSYELMEMVGTLDLILMSYLWKKVSLRFNPVSLPQNSHKNSNFKIQFIVILWYYACLMITCY